MEIIKFIVLAIGFSAAAVLIYGAYRFNFGEDADAPAKRAEKNNTERPVLLPAE
jgi:hypothetical protein